MILTGGAVGVVGGSFADPALRRDDCPPVLQDFWPVWVVRGVAAAVSEVVAQNMSAFFWRSYTCSSLSQFSKLLTINLAAGLVYMMALNA